MTSLNKKYIIVSGATATGKTATSIRIAQYIKTLDKKAEIINFDSLLFYKELNIGTAKPSISEMKGITHHLVSSASITDPVNASNFVMRAKKIISTLFKKEVIPILVGGSAFYVRALIKGMIESEEELSKNFDTKELNRIIGSPTLTTDYLSLHDPEILKMFHANDLYRRGRAIEFHFINKKKYSEKLYEVKQNRPYDFSHNSKIQGEMLHIYLELEKSKHLDIMEKRVKEMIKNGLIEEVKKLLEQGFGPELKPLASIGYKETINFVERDSALSTDDLIENIFISTRQLAKSQKTFFKKITPKIQIDPTSDQLDLFKAVEDFIRP